MYSKCCTSKTSVPVQNTGIDFGKDICQYVAVEDTCINFVTLLPLKNEAQFIKMIRDSYDAKKNTIQKNGIPFTRFRWCIHRLEQDQRRDRGCQLPEPAKLLDEVLRYDRRGYGGGCCRQYRCGHCGFRLSVHAPKIVDTTMAPESDTATMEIELAP